MNDIFLSTRALCLQHAHHMDASHNQCGQNIALLPLDFQFHTAAGKYGS